MAVKKVKVDIDVNANVEPSIASLKELKNQLKNAAAGSAEFKQIANSIDDMEDSIKGARKGSANWIDTLESAGGPLGMLGSGLNSLKVSFSSFNTALKTSVIGIVVAALGGMVAAFSQNEAAMKKLQPIFIAFEKILGGIFRALEPVLDIFVEMAMKALPIITTGIGGFYSALFSLFTFIKTTGLGIGKILKGIFTLDFDSVEEGLDGLKNVFSDTAKSFTDTYKRFEDGTKEVTKTEKENEEERKKIADEARAKREKAVADELAKRKADLDARILLEINKENTSREKLTELYKLRYEAELQGQKLTDSQKQVLRDENSKKVEEALNTDKETRQKAFDEQLKQLQDFSKQEQDQLNANLNLTKALYGENSAEARKTQDEIFVSQQNALQKEKDLLNQKQELTDAETARLKSIGIEEQNLTTTIIVENDKRIKSDTDAAIKRGEEQKKEFDDMFQMRMEQAGLDYEQQQQILNDRLSQDKAFYEQQLQIEGLTEEQRKVIRAKQTEDIKKNADAQVKIEEAKAASTINAYQQIGQALGALGALVGQQTAAGKAFALAQIAIDSGVAIAGIVRQASKNPLNLTPFNLFADIALRTTSVLGSIAKARQLLKGADSSTSSGGSTPQQQPRQLASGGFVSGPGTGTSDSIPAMLSNGESVINARSTSMFKPLLSTINRIGGGRQFAEGGIATTNTSMMNELNNALSMSQQPIKTYVVAQDMSSMQQFDRASKSRSTL